MDAKGFSGTPSEFASGVGRTGVPGLRQPWAGICQLLRRDCSEYPHSLGSYCLRHSYQLQPPAFAFSSRFIYFCLPSMPIRLLALDLDGTLLNPRGLLTERNRKAIEAPR